MRPGQPIAQRLNQPALRSPADFRVNGRRPGILPDLVSTPRHPSPVAHNWPAASCVTHGPRNLDRLSLLGLGRVKLRRLGRQRRPADFGRRVLPDGQFSFPRLRGCINLRPRAEREGRDIERAE
jgi:hypothetical protein